MIPVLLDTDIGSDIDDALCLAYLLRQPRCELLGITTVSGEPEKRVMLADAICQAEGRGEIPIHSGSPLPLLGAQRQPEAPQAAILARRAHRADFPACTAVTFLRETIRDRPGEVTLLAVGPMTNLGLLFRLDPEIPALLRALVLMCGAFTTRTPPVSRTEWNAGTDAHATAIIYSAGVNRHLSIGLDVTARCLLEADVCRREFRGGGLDVVAEMAEVWFERSGRICFHDPLAAAVIFAPELVIEEAGQVEVELISPRVPGMTHWQPMRGGPHQVAVDVQPERFFEHYLGILRKGAVG